VDQTTTLPPKLSWVNHTTVVQQTHGPSVSYFTHCWNPAYPLTHIRVSVITRCKCVCAVGRVIELLG